MMFTPPAGDPTAAMRAAERTQDLFLGIVGRIVGSRRFGFQRPPRSGQVAHRRRGTRRHADLVVAQGEGLRPFAVRYGLGESRGARHGATQLLVLRRLVVPQG
ncbi:hypothetical protein H7I01_15355 [Mycobacterium palustre]|nr:hypothetical protein [Mycobacterium palustre]